MKNLKFKQGTNKVFNFALKILTTLANTKALTALKDGFVLTMPVTLIGSIFLLIANLPITGYSEFMSSRFGTDWASGLNQVSGATFDVLAIISVVCIAYCYAKNENEDGISNAILALISFIIVTASTVKTDNGDIVSSVIDKTWTGGQGVITAIIVGLLSSAIYCFFVKRKITIKMPQGVPQGVSNAFIAVIPGIVILSLSMIVFYVFKYNNTTLTEWIFKTLQTPMQKLTDTYLGGLIMVFLCAILFWAGLHGPNIVMGPILPILTANSISNSELFTKGTLSVANGAYIVTPQVLDYFVKMGGTGVTLGLIIAALMSAKSKQMKDISKLALVPGLFNINEPIIFGLPIVYNPIMLVPFVLVPMLTFTLVYVCIYIGFLDPFTAVQVPWTMPPIISGFILQGFKGVFIQVLVIIMSTSIYYPFVKLQDKVCASNEKQDIEKSV